MVESVSIPDEAWGAVETAVEEAEKSFWDDDEYPPGGYWAKLGAEAAAPHIARAARIDELRQLAGEIGNRADDSRHDNEEYSKSSVLETVHTRITERLMELLEGQGDG